MLYWLQGPCRVYIDEVVLRRGDTVMRLRLNLRLDNERNPGPTEFLIDTPAFQPGTFELGLPLPPGELDGPAWVTADRWCRLPDRVDRAVVCRSCSIPLRRRPSRAPAASSRKASLVA